MHSESVGRCAVGAVLAGLGTAAALLLLRNLTLGSRPVRVRPEPGYGVRDAQFLRAMGSIFGAPLVAGNRVQVLVNGDEAFPAMLAAIRGARRSITMETYIFWSGAIGREFAAALAERARAGVRVHLLFDWVGGDLDSGLLHDMACAGVEIRRYNSPRWHNLDRLNNRTHRRLLVVDGAIGFTGGVGIADAWRGDGEKAQHWRDSHHLLEGPAVAQMQGAFIDNWLSAAGAVLDDEDYLPALAPVGSARAQVFAASPSGGAASMRLMYLLSIGAARESIRISASYFVPDAAVVEALVRARRRGVSVQIVLPGHIDWPLVRRASRATWRPLLEAGVEIHEYQPAMYHVKMMVVDEVWVSVGSTNFDRRSFAINDEANLNVHDAAFARRQVAAFEGDLERSRRVSLAQWRSRSRPQRLADRAASLLSAQI